MPNNIKNKIEIIGTKEQVDYVLEKFSTFHERVLHRTADGRLIICNDANGKFIGWFDDSTNEFESVSKRGNKIDGMPNGAEYGYKEAFIQMPDFNKIIKCPESLNITSGSVGDMGYSIISGNSENQFMSMQDQYKRFYEMDEDRRIEVMEMGIAYFKNVKEHGCKTWYDWNIKHWGTKWNSYSCKKEADNIFTFETAWAGVPKLIQQMCEKLPDIEVRYSWSDEDIGNNCGAAKFKDGNAYIVNHKNGSRESYELAFELRPDYKDGYKLIDGNYEYVGED